MKINTKLILPLAILCLSAGVHAQDSPEIKVAGIRVIREAVGKEQERMVPFNTFSMGTALALLIDSPVAIIKFEDDRSQIDSFADDKGTNLLIKTEGSFQNIGFGSFPKISADGTKVMLEIAGEGVPVAGATTINAKGTLVVQAASKKKTIRSEPFALTKGAAVKVGDIRLKLKEVGKPGFGDAALELEFETSDKAVTVLAGVKFLDASGKELESNSAGSSSMGFGNKYTYGRSYMLKKAVEGKVVLQFEVWTDLAEMKIPFSIAAGIGG